MTIDTLKGKIGEYIKGTDTFLDEVAVTVDRDAIIPVCRILKEDEECLFDFLSDCCGVDRLPETPRFMVVYNLYSLKHRHRIRIKVPLEESDAEIDSLTPIWNAANWLERECFDMFGIRFTGHPDLRRIITPPNLEGYPLRKDFPLDGSEKND
ncbi:MAG: NADH-quinone oxidoreductase subunit C [Deltaproteobacteria bacterium]|nr:NADH-quinone oxidoreductase subunit C [Deltaproteobacteria bacterium]